jgi:hypothetical protein
VSQPAAKAHHCGRGGPLPLAAASGGRPVTDAPLGAAAATGGMTSASDTWANISCSLPVMSSNVGRASGSAAQQASTKAA